MVEILAALAALLAFMAPHAAAKPNIVFVWGDQWRAFATGYADDPNVKTPNLDRLAEASMNVKHPERSVLRLPHQRRGLPEVAGVDAKDPAAIAHGDEIADLVRRFMAGKL
ncbi:MAG TPA: hypothetical protein VGI81_28260 [Tepidisphaeraceae bacterium]